MSNIIIYDTNNWARITLEKDITGMGIETLLEEALRRDGHIRIFVFDGRKGNKRRRDLYPEYKATRKPAQDFFYENIKMFRDLLEYAPNKTARCIVDGYEADDVINFLAKQFSQVTIMTTDRDLTQITSACFPMIQTDLTDREYIRTYKTLVGDQSDNIKGVQGFGKTTWKNVPHLWPYLKMFCENPNIFPRELEEGLTERALTALKEASPEQIKLLWKITGFFDLTFNEVKIEFGKDKESKITECRNKYFFGG